MNWIAASALCALLFGGAHSVVAQTAPSERWIRFERAQDSDAYIDALTLQVEGSLRRFWTRRTYHQARRDGISYELIRYEVNCSQQTLRALAYASYGAGGTVIAQYDWSQRTDRPARAIVPDSLGERLSGELCA